MRSFISLVLVLVVIAMLVVAPAQARVEPTTGDPCSVAHYIPWAAIACFWQIYLDMGGGYNDWGDEDGVSGLLSDADDIAGRPGDADGVSGSKGGSDDIGGKPSRR